MSVQVILHAEIDCVSTLVHLMILVPVMQSVGLSIMNQFVPALMGILEIHQYLVNYVMQSDHTLESRVKIESFIYFTAPRPECTTDPECPDHLACIQEKCQNPCFTTTCGVNAQCKVTRHRAI